MAKTTTFTGNGAFGTAGNWDNGVPVDTDTMRFLDGDETKAVTGCPGASSGLALAKVIVGPRWRGKIATAADPCYLGGTTKVEYDAPLAKETFFAADAGDTPTIDINQCGPGDNALVLMGAGTWGRIEASAPSGFCTVLGTATLVRNLSGLRMLFDASAVLATLHQLGARAVADIYCAISSSLLATAGTANILAATAKTLASVDVLGPGSVVNKSTGVLTVTAATVANGGLLDLSQGNGEVINIGALYRLPGGKIRMPANQNIVDITTQVNLGGLTTLSTDPYSGSM